MQYIPVDHPFHVIGVDVMELPLTANSNKYIYHCVPESFHKMAISLCHSRSENREDCYKLLMVPMFGVRVPEALLSD